MDDKSLRYIGIAAAWVSIAVTELVMLPFYGGKLSFGQVFFMLWAIFPYGGLMLGDLLIRKIALVPKMSVIFCVVSVLMCGLTLCAYLDLDHKSSTESLIFVFLPLYLNALVILLVMIGVIWAGVLKSSKK